MAEIPFRTSARSRIGQVLDFARSVEERPGPTRRAVSMDVSLAVLAFAAALGVLGLSVHAVAVAALMAAPLAVRRRTPLIAFYAVLAVAFLAASYTSDVTFLVIVVTAYSAAVYSRRRGAALLSVGAAGVAVLIAFWNANSLARLWPAPSLRPAAVLHAVRPVLPLTVPSLRPGRVLRAVLPVYPPPGAARPIVPAQIPGHLASMLVIPGSPVRLPSMLAAVSLISIAIVGIAVHAGDRIRRLQAEHEAATRRTLETERARIASELHDVVTHNVSVMIVQAGAARQVLADTPDEARAALLAVEASGRDAMRELRHLLGLLSPQASEHGPDPAGQATGSAGDAVELRPAPGLGQLHALVSRVAAAGLPVELHAADVPAGLPPGLDLAAYRVIQEALTNVLKHAGTPRTDVRLRVQDGSLTVEVADIGAAAPAAGHPFPAARPAVPSAKRGLLGLRERVAIYGGTLEAGPRLGGGWLVRARFPADLPVAAAVGDPGAAVVAGTR